jgi:hypothetical protein
LDLKMRAIFHHGAAYAGIAQSSGDKSAIIYLIFNYIEFPAPALGLVKMHPPRLARFYPGGMLIADLPLTLFIRVRPPFLDTTPSQP